MPHSLLCAKFAPAWLCVHADVLLYLLPSLALALLIRFLGRRHRFFLVFYLAGTLCHELAHFGVGLLTLARPQSLSVVPRRNSDGWRLGTVAFANLRWYNAAPTALAPLAILAIPLLVAHWRVAGPWHFRWNDALLALLLAPQFLSFWPSRRDWSLALASWPYLLPVAAARWWLAR